MGAHSIAFLTGLESFMKNSSYKGMQIIIYLFEINILSAQSNVAKVKFNILSGSDFMENLTIHLLHS